MKVVIIWWVQGFGNWLAKYIHQHFSSDVSVVITDIVNENLPNQDRISYTTDSKSAVQDAQIVIFSVPIAQTQKVIQEIWPQLKPGTIVADVTSIKSFPTEAMQTWCKDCIIIPAHPMFWPYVQDIAGQSVVLTPQESTKSHPAYLRLKTYLEQQGARVMEMSPTKHDQLMAVVQGLTHLSLFVMATTMKELWLDISDTEAVSSPIYKMILSATGRYIGQNPKLYADIQMYNDQVPLVQKHFTQMAETFQIFTNQRDEQSFVSLLQETKHFFGDHTIKGQRYTDKLIYLTTQQNKLLQDHIGKQVTLTNMYTGEQKIWLLISFDADNMVLDWDTRLFTDEWIIEKN